MDTVAGTRDRGSSGVRDRRESGNAGMPPAPDVVREPDGGLVIAQHANRRLEDYVGVSSATRRMREAVTTLAGCGAMFPAKCRAM